MYKYFDFEKPIAKVDEKIEQLKKNNTQDNLKKINKYTLEKKKIFEKIYSNLNAWQKVQVARHPLRPHCVDYIKNIFNDFQPLAGDKKFGEDKAIIGGLGKIVGGV